MPLFFQVKGDYPPMIGAWIFPIIKDLFDDHRPLVLRNKNGEEYPVDKDASELSFFFE